MRGSKTTALDAVQKINSLLAKHGIIHTSYGIIVSIKGRRDHHTTIKHRSHSGCHLLTIISKMYKQEFRIYDNISPNTLMNILKKNLGEQYRFLENK